MNSPLVKLFVSWATLALGVTLATKLVTGIRVDDTPSLIAVVALLSLFNAVLRPLMLLFSLPFIVLTLGLGVVLINALLFYWVGHLVDGFHVADFWAALWGALIVSITNVILSAFMKTRVAVARGPGGPAAGPKKMAKSDDVIDI